MILGLDISTSIVGVTILDRSGEIIHNEAWDIRNKKKFPSSFKKLRFIKDRLIDLKVRYCIDKIFIEKSLQAFRSGFSSARTLSLLSSFNGTTSWFCYDLFDVEPEYISASSARKLCGIKIPKGEKAKKIVLQFLLDNEPKFTIEYTKHNNPKPGYYDMADSIVIAKAGFKLCQETKK